MPRPKTDLALKLEEVDLIEQMKYHTLSGLALKYKMSKSMIQIHLTNQIDKLEKGGCEERMFKHSGIGEWKKLKRYERY